MSSEAVMRPDNLNYKAIPMVNGRYRTRKVPLNSSSSSTIVLQSAATTLVEWKLPANTVWNLGRSCIDYQISIPAPAAGWTWSFEDAFEICGAIQLCNASGVYLTDLQYANTYTNSVRKVDTDESEFEGNDFTSGLYKCIAPVSNPFPPKAVMPYSVVAAQSTNAYGQIAGTGLTGITAVEPQYSRVTAAATTKMTLTRSMPLSAFTQTAIGMDRDFIFPDDMYIRMQIAPASRVAFTSLSATDGGSTPAALAPALMPTIYNLALQLAMQVDPIAEASVRQKFLEGGMKFLIPYVYAWKNTTAAGTPSIQISLNNQFGNKLKRLVHVPYNVQESVNTAYDHQNLDGVKIASYQTFIDSQPLQDAVISCKQPVVDGPNGMDDWRENKLLLRGSSIENSLAYYYNWCHVDSFSQPKRGKVLAPYENIIEGLDLSMPRQWTITATAPVGLNQYTFGTFVRQVVTGPQGTQVVVV